MGTVAAAEDEVMEDLDKVAIEEKANNTPAEERVGFHASYSYWDNDRPRATETHAEMELADQAPLDSTAAALAELEAPAVKRTWEEKDVSDACCRELKNILCNGGLSLLIGPGTRIGLRQGHVLGKATLAILNDEPKLGFDLKVMSGL